MKLRGMTPFDGPCASGPGWILVQRRFDGSVDFNRTWNEYKEGFGNIQGEFFMGLDRLHLMTSSAQHELCIRIADFDGDSAYAHYTHFEIGNEEESYELKYIEGYSGTAGNYLTANKNMKFSTIDRDNDKEKHNCAKNLNGWWFKECYFMSSKRLKFDDNPRKSESLGQHIQGCLRISQIAFEGRCASSSGWIVIQRRFDGSVDFNRVWNEYKEGFGTIEGEFFIGLETLHLLTNITKYELCVRIGDAGGDSAYAHYDDFQIGSEKESYELKSLGKYSGTAGDNLKLNQNMKFSTIDRDNDKFKGNCAIINGGWWYNLCWRSALNGPYRPLFNDVNGGGVKWLWKKQFTVSLAFAEMMVRPKSVKLVQK
ncbi:uncharacterized protein Dana_GF15463 [Drosophila ananassae]|uniref:Fibrinogen C-terminal domain-containing protein n=1 Tax=Drosophila ananassae TaxID=7217 RepID=B3ML37_DROAN|nr:uncharacterized protein Dana_GF15463 [Drosophila ananassae]